MNHNNLDMRKELLTNGTDGLMDILVEDCGLPPQSAIGIHNYWLKKLRRNKADRKLMKQKPKGTYRYR